MRLKSATAALVAATAVTRHGVDGLVIVTKTIIKTATAPLSSSCQSELLPQKAVKPSIESDLATGMETSTTLTTTTTTVGGTTSTTTLNTVVARRAFMSLGCGCKINKKNGFIDCASEDEMVLGSDGVPACAMSKKTATRPGHGAHTDTVANMNFMSVQTTREFEAGKPTDQRRSTLEAGDNSAGFIDQCSYQPRTHFNITSTPVDTSAPIYDFQFNPSLLGKPGPFSIDENGQLFDATSRMGTFDTYGKFRLRSPVAFTYPSPATWSACGTGNTLLFGTTDQFYQCGNVSFPAIWNTVPPGYTEASAQQGYSTTTCVKVKLVWSQIPEADLKKRQDWPYSGESTWPTTRGLLPGCTPQPTPLGKLGLQDGVLGDGGRHVAYDSTTATFAFAAEAVTEAPDENGAPAFLYTIAARTMVFKDEPTYATAAATQQKRQSDGATEPSVFIVRTDTTARALLVPQSVAPTPTSYTDLHDRPSGPTDLAARDETAGPTSQVLTIPGSTSVEIHTLPEDVTSTRTLFNYTDIVTTIINPPYFSTETYVLTAFTTTVEITATGSDAKPYWFYQPVTDPGSTFVLTKYLATTDAVYTFPLYQADSTATASWTTITTVASSWNLIAVPSWVKAYALGNLNRIGNLNTAVSADTSTTAALSTSVSASKSSQTAPTTVASTTSLASSPCPSSSGSSTASASPSSESGVANRSPGAAASTSSPPMDPHQNPNRCQMEHGCGTAYTTEVISWAAVNTVVGHLTISHEAGTSTVVKYDNPEPGDGPPPNMQVQRNVMEIEATHTTGPPQDVFASQPTATSSVVPYTGDASNAIDTDGSKQLVAATIGMAFFAVLAFLL